MAIHFPAVAGSTTAVEAGPRGTGTSAPLGFSVGTLCWLLSAGVYIAAKWVAPEMPPWTLCFWRVFLAALVLLPSRDFLAALPPDAAILSESPVSVTVRHAGPSNITPELYAAGAWLVLPAGNRGCAPE